MNNIPLPDPPPGVSIAFFDLDETITDADTDSLWAAWRSRRTLRGMAERAWLAKLYRDFRKGRMSIDEYMKFQKFRIGRLDAGEFQRLGKDFFREVGRRHLYGEAAGLIGRMKKTGCRIVLLTAQNDCIAGPFAEFLGMDAMIANRFRKDRGRFTVPVRPYSFGEGKVVLGRNFAEQADVPLASCAFFGDSIYDAPFLDMVGFPCAVNPDPLLEARAREKNWRVAHFKTLMR